MHTKNAARTHTHTLNSVIFFPPSPSIRKQLPFLCCPFLPLFFHSLSPPSVYNLLCDLLLIYFFIIISRITIKYGRRDIYQIRIDSNNNKCKPVFKWKNLVFFLNFCQLFSFSMETRAFTSRDFSAKISLFLSPPRNTYAALFLFLRFRRPPNCFFLLRQTPFETFSPTLLRKKTF